MIGSPSQSQDPSPGDPAGVAQDRHDWNNPARMPTRFGVGLMLLFLTLFSVGFCILKACGTSPTVILFLTLLFTVVGFAQILWPSQPRVASALSGGMYLPLFTLGFIASQVVSEGLWQLLVEAAPMAFCVAPLGAICGYLAGALLAGIFLRVGLSSQAPHGLDGDAAAGVLAGPLSPGPQT